MSSIPVFSPRAAAGVLTRRVKVTVAQLLGAQNKIETISLSELPNLIKESAPRLEDIIRELNKFAQAEANKLKPIQQTLNTIQTLTTAYERIITIVETIEKVKPKLNKVANVGLVWANPSIVSDVAQELILEIQASVVNLISERIAGLKSQVLETEVEIPEIIAKAIL